MVIISTKNRAVKLVWLVNLRSDSMQVEIRYLDKWVIIVDADNYSPCHFSLSIFIKTDLSVSIIVVFVII